ncbi:hypothetical protein N7499_008980 [Penicillium canescens]|nr:hypothetical protein N7499_008980 [Penicillium canescens]KAJ6159310.1 hypothetical protein N7485_012136 [Penicillium canescens]
MDDAATSDRDTQATYPSGVSFVHVQHPGSPPQSQRRRAELSCEPCRKRKLRCEASESLPGICVRCRRDGKTCKFRTVKYRRRRIQPSTDASAPTSAANDQAGGDADSTEPQNQATTAVSVTSQQPWLTVPSEMQYEHGSEVRHPLDLDSSPGTASNSTANLDPKMTIMSMQMRNTADALDLLTFAATTERQFKRFSSPEKGSAPGNAGSFLQGDSARTDIAIESDIRWNQCYLIQRRLVSVHEAIEYIGFFFSYLWPLKPVIPAYYKDPSKYVLLATEEPVLLNTVIALASRYHTLTGSHGEIRSERIHWQVWSTLQTFLQSAIWGSIKTRSLGTIASMLLLIGWHTRAIHNPGSFGLEGNSLMTDSPLRVAGNDRLENAGNLISMQKLSHLGGLDIMSSAYRSNKMSWMLLANAIALAQEGCCFEIETPNLIDDEKTAERSWACVVCVFIYLIDEHLAIRLGLEPLLPEKSRSIVVHSFSKVFASALPERDHWESYFELTEEIRNTREYLHGLKQTASRPYSYDVVPVLEHTQRRLERWRCQFAVQDQRSLLGACLSIEVRYAVIYSLSPASHVRVSEVDEVGLLRVQNLRDAAVRAARELLSLVTDVLEPSNLLRYIPVHCWLFTMAASLHLLKEALLHEPNITDQDLDIQLLRKTVEALRRGAPDDVHTAGRFSQIMGYLVDAVLKPSANSARASQFGQAPLRMLDISGSIPLNGAFDSPLGDLLWWNDALSLLEGHPSSYDASER